jgi:hypothetical protein
MYPTRINRRRALLGLAAVAAGATGVGPSAPDFGGIPVPGELYPFDSFDLCGVVSSRAFVLTIGYAAPDVECTLHLKEAGR